jgi:hypothetical protein
MISLLLGSLSTIGWLIYNSLSKDPSVPLADFDIVGKFIGQLCMPLVCLLYGIGGWLASRSATWRILGYFLFFLGLALLLLNEYAMVAYGLT